MQCFDCKKELQKGDFFTKYENGLVKCKECFEINSVLEGYQPVETYSRVVGFHTPINRWNKGKAAEWGDRKTFEVDEKQIAEQNVLNAPTID